MDIRDPNFKNDVRQDGRQEDNAMIFNPKENKSTLEPAFRVDNIGPKNGVDGFDNRLCSGCGEMSDSEHREECCKDRSQDIDWFEVSRISNGFLVEDFEKTLHVADKQALLQWIEDNL